jgi:hypothetical protein
MTREDIIRMAQSVMEERGGSRMDDEEDLIAYSLQLAVLVATAEREACAKEVDHILKEGGGTYGDAIRARGNT